VRLLTIITLPNHGGAQMHLLSLMRGLKTKGISITLATSREGFLTEKGREIGIEIRIVPHLTRQPNVYHDTLAFLSIRRLLQTLQPSLLHLHSSKAGILGRVAGYLGKIPTIYTAHGWAFAEGASLKQKILSLPLEAAVARLGGHIITVSHYDYELALQYRVASPRQMTVVHNGIPDIGYRANPGKPAVPRIVMVARFSYQKDHGLLLKALSRLQREAWQLDFVGDGPLLASVSRLANELGIGERVRFLGARSDIPEILAGSDIFVLTSRYEGFPISILEAMRAGLPVVASDVGGVSEAVLEGLTGFLIRRGDWKTLRDRLKTLLINPELRVRMGKRGRKRYEQLFTLDRMVNKTLRVYEHVLEQAKS